MTSDDGHPKNEMPPHQLRALSPKHTRPHAHARRMLEFQQTSRQQVGRNVSRHHVSLSITAHFQLPPSPTNATPTQAPTAPFIRLRPCLDSEAFLFPPSQLQQSAFAEV
ncbi:hypothetical protein CVT26_009703 [Gymnopilus dilepis]|uniref:Uncharacterized protein n=1 Tax=Gymnopilus dilepis TaxID=231916 RepID=A0A409YBN9_9AGAR|nr:hypothetical protein CVT26_009703 [Gymnopilus dilepis]